MPRHDDNLEAFVEEPTSKMHMITITNWKSSLFHLPNLQIL